MEGFTIVSMTHMYTHVHMYTTCMYLVQRLLCDNSETLKHKLSTNNRFSVKL